MQIAFKGYTSGLPALVSPCSNIYMFDSLKIRSGTQTGIVGKKSGAQMGADPGVSTQVVVEPLLVRACLVLHTLKRLLGGNLDVPT